MQNVLSFKKFFFFQPTRSDIRGWVIPFVVEGTPWYFYIAAAIPACLLTILLFMDQQITSVIVNRKEHQLKVKIRFNQDPAIFLAVIIGTLQ